MPNWLLPLIIMNLITKKKYCPFCYLLVQEKVANILLKYSYSGLLKGKVTKSCTAKKKNVTKPTAHKKTFLNWIFIIIRIDKTRYTGTRQDRKFHIL